LDYALKKVKDEFSLDVMNKKYEELYNSILDLPFLRLIKFMFLIIDIILF